MHVMSVVCTRSVRPTRPPIRAICSSVLLQTDTKSVPEVPNSQLNVARVSYSE